jgi:hypothetical protein
LDAAARWEPLPQSTDHSAVGRPRLLGVELCGGQKRARVETVEIVDCAAVLQNETNAGRHKELW